MTEEAQALYSGLDSLAHQNYPNISAFLAGEKTDSEQRNGPPKGTQPETGVGLGPASPRFAVHIPVYIHPVLLESKVRPLPH